MWPADEAALWSHIAARESSTVGRRPDKVPTYWAAILHSMLSRSSHRPAPDLRKQLHGGLELSKGNLQIQAFFVFRRQRYRLMQILLVTCLIRSRQSTIARPFTHYRDALMLFDRSHRGCWPHQLSQDSNQILRRCSQSVCNYMQRVL